MVTERKTCFVIMPFSKTKKEHTKKYWNNHYEKFLKPLIEENPNLEALRSKPRRESIIGEIIKNLVVCPVVVADLTDFNPNVYWELGVRQSFKHGTVTIAEDGTKPPFDVSDKGILFYSNGRIENEEFRKNFKEAIQDCLDTPKRPDSRVLEAISGRGTLFEIFNRDEAIRRLDAVISEGNTNLKILDSLTKTAQKNKEDPDNRTFITLCLRVAATELLVTNRYVDEDKEFFESAEIWLLYVGAMNDQIRTWGTSVSTDDLLLQSVKDAVKRLNDFKDKVNKAHEKISKFDTNGKRCT